MKALNRFEELGLTEKIFTAAAIIGLLVIGGMSASMVSINPVVAIGSGDNAIKLIDVINGIMPKVLSLLPHWASTGCSRRARSPTRSCLASS